MKRVLLLYICTGKYNLLWNDFFDSFERNFLPGFEKKYLIFSDNDNHDIEESKLEALIGIEHMPWPLVTLLRFDMFSKVESVILDFDYVFFCNANLRCIESVTENDLMFDNSSDLIFVKHRCLVSRKAMFYPAERNPQSTSYIPYDAQFDYVTGAFYGGKVKAFCSMMERLADSVAKDLANNIIAKWHDESHINRYVAEGHACTIISEVFCASPEMCQNGNVKIVMANKSKYFDVDSFKNNYRDGRFFKKRNQNKFYYKIANLCYSGFLYANVLVKFSIDWILMKRKKIKYEG